MWASWLSLVDRIQPSENVHNDSQCNMVSYSFTRSSPNWQALEGSNYFKLRFFICARDLNVKQHIGERVGALNNGAGGSYGRFPECCMYSVEFPNTENGEPMGMYGHHLSKQHHWASSRGLMSTNQHRIKCGGPRDLSPMNKSPPKGSPMRLTP